MTWWLIFAVVGMFVQFFWVVFFFGAGELMSFCSVLMCFLSFLFTRVALLQNNVLLLYWHLTFVSSAPPRLTHLFRSWLRTKHPRNESTFDSVCQPPHLCTDLCLCTLNFKCYECGVFFFLGVCICLPALCLVFVLLR